MFLLSLLRLPFPPRIPLRMPPVARVTTGTVTPRRSGRTRTVVNEEHEGPMDLGAENPLTDLESEEAAEPPSKKKRRRKVKLVEPVLYDIPPVELKTTSFKGTDGVSMRALPRVYEQPFRSVGIRMFHHV